MYQAVGGFEKLHTSGRVLVGTGVAPLPKDIRSTARLHREWLARVCQVTGLQPTKLAKAAGLAPSTLTRPLAEGDNGVSTLHAATIEKLVTFSGLTPPGSAGGERRPLRGFREDAAPFDAKSHDSLADAVRALTAGRNGVDPWTIKSRALELAGYLPGDVVLVDLNAVPAPGDAVCAQVYDWRAMQAETVMRIFRRVAPFEILLARSLDPAFDEPLIVDGERVIVKGVLLPHRLRQPRAA